jgi:SAM-dependent methyltransferase
MTGTAAPLTATSRQATWNAGEWSAGKHLTTYANRVLTPAEVQLFLRYRDKLAGRVLDVGCGAGRVLAYLVMNGADAEGIDLAPAMVEYCRRTVPQATVRLGDASEISRSVSGPFDVVIAPDNLIDVFGDQERRRVIAEIRELLAPDGLFIFSTHDLGWHDTNLGPREFEQTSAVGTLRKLADVSPRRVLRALSNRREIARNRKRLGPLQQRHDDYAIINDFPHNYSLLHYYIGRDDQEAQLRDLGFELVECLACDGRTIGPGGSGDSDSLYYVARPV